MSIDPSYRPIRDYAMIGDGRTAALVGSNGSIDWCCWPRFDSAAVFCRLLDASVGGHFLVAPKEGHGVSRSYVDGTNVLTTTFTTNHGTVRLTDLMPVSATGGSTRPRHRLLRLIEGLAGEVECGIEFRPTFDFARTPTEFNLSAESVVARTDAERLMLECPATLAPDSKGTANGSLSVTVGQRFWLALEYSEGPAGLPAPPNVDAEAELRNTLEYWRRWSEACTYSGLYHDRVRRSALALKLLVFEPSGAIVAAPTTSLPEAIGGGWNWDYRYAWLRDSALTLDTLQMLGYHDESIRFFEWLENICRCDPDDLQIMYRVDGGSDISEHVLDHLDGYRGSRPVRVGNAAAGQQQLDAFGAVLDVTYLCFERMPRPLDPRLWNFLRRIADRVTNVWCQPDHGIWEIRGEHRHYVHSKLHCWLALDRAVRLADRFDVPGDTARWRRVGESIRRSILKRGYDPNLSTFTQAFDRCELDASVLNIPLVGFLPADDPRMISTIQRIEEQLVVDGLVHRFVPDDRAAEHEGAFALCSFWLVDNLALLGRVDDARELFERICGYANDVGLLAEQIDPESGELLGNHPQAFTHLGLIRAAHRIAEAEQTS